MLVKDGVSVSTPDLRGRSPAHAAASNNLVGTLQVLADAARLPISQRGSGGGGADGASGNVVKNFPDLDLKDEDGASPLHLAAAAGHLEAVAFLVKAGADINAIDGAGLSCVWTATVNGQV